MCLYIISNGYTEIEGHRVTLRFTTAQPDPAPQVVEREALQIVTK